MKTIIIIIIYIIIIFRIYDDPVHNRKSINHHPVLDVGVQLTVICC